MNESVKDIIFSGLAVSGGVVIALLFVLGLYRLVSVLFHEICKRINKHKP